jgi:hypothetical protein
MWKTCFNSAAAGNQEVIRLIPCLLRTYLLLPHSELLAPRASTVLHVLRLHLAECSDAQGLELVRDVLQQRLGRDPSLNTISASTRRAVDEAANECQRGIPTAAHRAMTKSADLARVLQVAAAVNTELTAYTALVAALDLSAAPGEDTGVVEEVLGWLQYPTVGWLSSGCLQNGPELKTSYDSVADYYRVVRHVWTMLTFYWGAAAVWPQCTCATGGGGGGGGGNDKNLCKTPLLTPVSKGGTSCSMHISEGGAHRVCSRPALWRCFRSGRQGHQAICGPCLHKKQAALMGPSSGQSSTDVYDGRVALTGHQGDSFTVHLSHVASRKPPGVGVNWRTTYRLQPAALVGVIHVAASGLALEPEMRIYWGELVNKERGPDAAREEYRRRDRGGALCVYVCVCVCVYVYICVDVCVDVLSYMLNY